MPFSVIIDVKTPDFHTVGVSKIVRPAHSLFSYKIPVHHGVSLLADVSTVSRASSCNFSAPGKIKIMFPQIVKFYSLPC